jgi:hypothetical protein
MVRHLFILSRRDPDLYAYLKERFADDDAVEVILDRRHASASPARGGGNTAGSQDRRRRPEADTELLARSYTIVTLAEAPTRSSLDTGLRRSSRVGLRPTV